MGRQTMVGKGETSWLDERNQDPEIRRVFEQERLVVRITEAILAQMEQRGFSRASVARALGASRAHVSELLTGRRNMTLHTLADLASALGCRAELELIEQDMPAFRPLDIGVPNIREPARLSTVPQPQADSVVRSAEDCLDSEFAVAA